MSDHKVITFFFWANYHITHPEIGTTTKIHSEIVTLRKMGYTVTYTAYLDDGVAIYDNNDNVICKEEYLTKNKFYIICARRRLLILITRRYLRNHAFDFCLLRINNISHSYFSMLRDMKQQKAFVMMESLSYYPYMDLKNNKKASYWLIDRSLRKHAHDLKEVVDLMLTEGKIDDFYGIPSIDFGMGIDVDIYQCHRYNGKRDELNLLMVGCHSVYHGTDRIIRSLRYYYDEHANERKVNLHLVGDVKSRDKKLIEKLHLEEVIFCYGRKHGKELDAIYEKCNIALGPLAQFRLNKKDTGLKTKEYFARGIPYVYSGEEIEIESSYPYIRKVENSDSIIDLNEINQFKNDIYNNGNISEAMRTKAKDIFSWRKKFERVFSKVEQLKA